MKDNFPYVKKRGSGESYQTIYPLPGRSDFPETVEGVLPGLKSYLERHPERDSVFVELCITDVNKIRDGLKDMKVKVIRVEKKL
ncbi:MAG: hypothetical protein NTY20_05660 [Candidatus Aenigmarchaeota archaeon]|nr:hypothetical protein [Candidatus Aenigmarchaeota archaeon]